MPKEIAKLADKSEPYSPERSYLFDAWVTSEESWSKSRLLQILRSKDSNLKKGLRRWSTFQEMADRWGKTVAEDIVNHKLADKNLREREVRKHPDCPEREAMNSFTNNPSTFMHASVYIAHGACVPAFRIWCSISCLQTMLSKTRISKS